MIRSTMFRRHSPTADVVTATAPRAAVPTALITSRPAGAVESLHELWRSHELVYFLAWRDVRVRYKQALLGTAWAVLRPLLLTLVFSFLFSRVAKVPSGGVPYPEFAFVGLVTWTYFSTAVQNASDSLVAGANLVSKIYFPRIALPLASLGAQLPDLAVGLGVLAVFMAWYGTPVHLQILLVVPLLALLVIVALSVSVWLSALNVAYRDVKHVVPFFLQMWLFVTPVLYPSTVLPNSVRALYGINPMAGLIEMIRWATLDTPPPDPMLVTTSLTTAAVLLFTGLRYFRRSESVFADVI